MTSQGLFSGNPNNRAQVDKQGLRALTVEKVAAGLQSQPGNEMAGLEGRTELLIRLANALDEKKEYFGEDGRPGNMVGKCSHMLYKRLWLLTRQTISYHTPRHRLRLCSSCLCQCYGTYL